MDLPDFSDLVAPVQTECRNHCRVYLLLSVMEEDRASKVVAAIKARDIPAALMARRFAAAQDYLTSGVSVDMDDDD